jgi:lipopolysaccharide transport system permease protein
MAEGQELQKVVIESNGKNLQYWKDFWRYRGMLFSLTRRDFTVRYKQTLAGASWSLINPVVQMILMTFLFGNIAGFQQSTEIPYHICVYAGILPWGLFARTVQIGSGAFMGGKSLMDKVYFPRLILPLSSMCTALLDTLISYGILGIVMAIWRYLPPARILLSFVLLLPMALVGTFIGLFLSTLVIRFRDLNYLIPLALQLGQYVTPVAYTAENISGRLEGTAGKLYMAVYNINPIVGFEQAFKWCVLRDQTLDVPRLLYSCAFLVLCVVVGVWRFRKAERTFVDII